MLFVEMAAVSILGAISKKEDIYISSFLFGITSPPLSLDWLRTHYTDRHSVAELLSVGQVGIFDQLMFTSLSLVQQQQQGVSRKLSLFQIFQKYQFMARDPYIHIVPLVQTLKRCI